ncbi:MAG: UPF0280 family protein [Hyphomicrobiales bacterium]|nr:UPF0280 family protein [Hyphomicrobiales bacterium]
MSARMQVAILPGARLHLNDGPIDLVIGADGDAAHMRRAYAAATRRFSGLLDELCDERPLLRAAMTRDCELPFGVVARRMDAAARPLAHDRFITRMAAVAGAVADEILAAMLAAAPLRRAYVNNGGDIAVHLAAGQSFAIGLVERPDRPSLFGNARIRAVDPVRGIATSGWRGRSFSLGVADAVTILARDAAGADAAATLVANAVDLPGHPGVERAPAAEFDPQSDLGDRLVTRAVGPLAADEIETALRCGVAEARRLIEAGAIEAAALRLAGETKTIGRLRMETIEATREEAAQ